MVSQQVAPALAYRVADVCKSIGLSVSTVYDLIARGELRAVKLAGRTVVPAAELQRLLDEAPPITLNRNSRVA
jgi:excisionase family DNA binding protein